MTQPEPSAAPQPERAPLDVVRHVISCDPCNASVEGLTDQEDVLRHFASPRQHPALVDHMLGQTAKMGKYELGTLLYEMGRASLMLVPEARLHVEFFVQPKPLASLSQNAKRLTCRVSAGDVQRVLDSPTAIMPARGEAASLSLAFADAFLALDSERPKALLLRGCALTELGRFDAALVELDEILSRSAESQIELSARKNITRTMILAGNHKGALLRSRHFVNSHSSDPTLWLNYAIAAAWQDDVDQFQTACQGFESATTDGTVLNNIHWQRLLDTEVPWLAERFDLAEECVAESLGVNPRGHI